MICERCGHELLHGPARLAHGSEQCLANLRADLVATRAEIAALEVFRAAPLATIRKLLDDEESPDEVIVGSVCATILTHRALAANARAAEKGALDAETRACAAEERAHDLGALLRYHASKPK